MLRRKSPHVAAILLALPALSISIARDACAEPHPSLDLRRFSPSPDPRALLYLEPADTPARWQFNTAAWLSYAYRPLVLRDANGDTVAKLVSGQASADVAANIGLGRRFALGVVLPIVLAQSGDDNTLTQQALDGGKIPAQAIGDLALVGKGTLISAGELGGFSLAGLSRVTLPTGSRASTIGEGGVTGELRVLAEMRFAALSGIASLGVKVREERTFVNETWGNELPWGVGVSLKPKMFGFDSSGRWTTSVEMHGWLPAGPAAPFTSAPQTPAFAGVSARYTVRDVSGIAGLEAPVGHGAGAPILRAVVGIGWAPREHDRDHDGVDDDHDKCMFLAEDRDGFEDDDGCPELDNDNDGVLDPDDKCPTEKEDEDDFEDDDGCPDLDNDKDGIPDTEDACPNEAGPPSPERKKNGCVDKDPDHDGIPNPKDKCPNEPEDKDGFQDDDGCPDPDNDNDGIPDAEDACPRAPGKADPIGAKKGCPSPDDDGDGIANAVDKCPNEGETYNGVDDEDGCPEPAKPGVKPLVDVVEKKGVTSLVLTRAPQFEPPPKATTAPAPKPVPPTPPTPPTPPGKPAPVPTPPPSTPVVKPSLTTDGQATVRAIAQVLLLHKPWWVKVALRPAPGEAEALTEAKLGTIVTQLNRVTHRPNAAVVAPWERGKMSARAEMLGISVDLITDQPAPAPPPRPGPVKVPPPNVPKSKTDKAAAPTSPAPLDIVKQDGEDL